MTDNPAAYPSNAREAVNPGEHDPELGMTLRDYFAGQALAGILSNSNAVARLSWLDDQEDKAALGAYLYADAMLAERAKGGDQ